MTDGLIDVHAHFTTEDYIRAAIAAGHRDPTGCRKATGRTGPSRITSF